MHDEALNDFQRVRAHVQGPMSANGEHNLARQGFDFANAGDLRRVSLLICRPANGSA
jgi:hypothetical protein